MNIYGDEFTTDMRQQVQVAAQAMPKSLTDFRVISSAVSAWKPGVGDGNRTHNVRSHSPVLCQLSYSHH